MDLYKEILIKALENQKMQVFFPELQMSLKDIIEVKSYRTLCKIRDIVQDETLDDKECFEKIERIIVEFEKIGSDGGFRHDF